GFAAQRSDGGHPGTAARRVVSAGRMTDQPPGDLAALVANLVQQQTVLVQQQAALVQIHGESIRMQRLLVERLLGSPVADISTASSQPQPTGSSGALPSTTGPPLTQTLATP